MAKYFFQKNLESSEKTAAKSKAIIDVSIPSRKPPSFRVPDKVRHIL